MPLGLFGGRGSVAPIVTMELLASLSLFSPSNFLFVASIILLLEQKKEEEKLVIYKASEIRLVVAACTHVRVCVRALACGGVSKATSLV